MKKKAGLPTITKKEEKVADWEFGISVVKEKGTYYKCGWPVDWEDLACPTILPTKKSIYQLNKERELTGNRFRTKSLYKLKLLRL